MNFSALDIETSSDNLEHPEYALQPWRPEFRVDLVMLGAELKTDPEKVAAAIKYYDLDLTLANEFVCVALRDTTEWDILENGFVWTWNGIFDIAGLMSQGIDCSKVQWLDAMSAAKWVLRSQKTDAPDGSRFSWSLGNVVKHCLKEWAHYDEFLNIKAELKDDPGYWRRRCELDVEATLRLGTKFWNLMTPHQRKGFIIEQQTLYPMAKAWLDGCHYDFEKAEELRTQLESEADRLTSEIGAPRVVLDSYVKRAALIYDTWKVPFDKRYCLTDKGEELLKKGQSFDEKKYRGTGKKALTFLIEVYSQQFPKLQKVKDYREHSSRVTKFCNGPIKCQTYLGSDIMHHNWRPNSTYTGRCTVSSKVRVTQ